MAQGKKKPTVIDVETLIAAGIDPKTGLPYRWSDFGCLLKSGMKKIMEIVDRQDAINRYTWHNLPDGITSQELERMLYYKGQVMFFYMEEANRFFALPYALDGGIDVLGRYMQVTPLPFGGSTSSEDGKPWITGLRRKPIYDVVLPEDLTDEHYFEGCVLIHDYSRGFGQLNTPRSVVNAPLLDLESEIPCFARTALLNSTGILGMRVNDESAQGNVELASRSVNDAALNGKKWIPIVDGLQQQPLTGGDVGKSEEFLLALQAFENFRLGLYGIRNGGIFQKKAHVLETEQELNSGSTGHVLQDGLTIRQVQADIINSVWDLDVFCEVSENAIEADLDMDGVISDEQDQSGSGYIEPTEGGTADVL